MHMLKLIDGWLDRVTMYRLLLYYLGGLLAAAVVASGFGALPFAPVTLVITSSVLLLACWVINKIFGIAFDVPVNRESALITGLILALIITPKLGQYDILFLLAAAGLAMASKYILTVNNMNIFNPAALAVALAALGPRQTASWWIGTAVMLPAVIIGGLLMVRKLRRFQMVSMFLLVTFAATALYTFFGHGDILVSLKEAALSSPAFFLGYVMLTEPLTSPSTNGKRLWYAALVGLLLPPQTHIFSLYSSPEVSLLIGNVYSFLVGRKEKMFLTLKQSVQIAADSADFIFSSPRQLAYQPGQYMEWTLPHPRADERGNRRYFTLASSPTEPELRIGVKFYEPSSSYKQTLLEADEHTPITASQVAGDFVLPKDSKRKLVFIAGGIGVTPFRSMIKYLTDKNEHRDIVIIYAAQRAAGVAYRDVFETARRQLHISTTYVLSDGTSDSSFVRRGTIDMKLVKELVPDYAGRTFYISGSHQMVADMQERLRQLGVRRRHIKTDYFPGYI